MTESEAGTFIDLSNIAEKKMTRVLDNSPRCYLMARYASLLKRLR